MAILRHLIGRTGRVTAIEFDPGLMARLERNFANARNVRVVQGDGTRVAFDPAQLIYVNAGATRPADRLQAPPGCYRERYSRLTRCWRRLPDLSQEVAPAFPPPQHRVASTFVPTLQG